jgi:folate-binding protein YgfZ
LPSTFTIVSTPSFYDSYRVLQGLSSSPIEIVSDKSLPLEHSLLECGGVSFGKGCYLGQELTARTHFQGVVRKRVWPAYATTRGQDAGMRGKPLPQLLAAVAFAASGSQQPPPTDADPFKQLQFYFPFFDPSIPSIPTDTPIMRAPATASVAPGAAAGEGATPAPAVAAAKEVSRVLSSQHNVFLAMLRSEHVEDETHTLQLQLQTDAPVGDALLTVVPYQPVWWNRPAADADANADADAKQTEGDDSTAGRT